MDSFDRGSQLHHNLRRNGTARRALPGHDAVAEFLLLGYACRLLDEAVGEQPLFKHDR
jgi:hypothetical protein